MNQSCKGQFKPKILGAIVCHLKLYIRQKEENKGGMVIFKTQNRQSSVF